MEPIVEYHVVLTWWLKIKKTEKLGLVEITQLGDIQ